MSTLFRRKPYVLTAVCFDGSLACLLDLCERIDCEAALLPNDAAELTFEFGARIEVALGEWLVEDADAGALTVMPAEEFESLYEPVPV